MLRFQSAAQTRRLLIISAVLCLAWTALSFGRAAAAPLSVSADPSKDLLDGQYTRVSWQNFPAGSNASLRQCNPAPTTSADCAPVSKVAKTRQDGKGETIFQVKTGAVTSSISCDAQTPCSVGVFWGPLNAQADFSRAAFATIEFGFPLSSCPPLNGQKVNGTGSSSANQAILKWEAAVCRTPHSLNVQYTVKNSLDGLEDFVAKRTDFGVSGVPLAPPHAEPTAETPPFVNVAGTLSGVSFAYTMNDQLTGEQVTNLKLTPDLIAEIFTGQILNWNDSRIKQLNPGTNFPPLIRAVGRADKSASTYFLTSWFNQVAKASYEAGGEPYRGGPTSIYPSTQNGPALVTGGEATAKAAGPQADTSAGTIAWVDTSLASFFGLGMVAVRNQAGNFVKPMDSNALAAGVPPGLAKNGAAFFQPDYTTVQPDAYPLPMVNYFLAPKTVEAAKHPVLKSFLTYELGDGQKALPPGYVPLPEPLVTSSRASVEQIQAASAPVEPAGGPAAVRQSTSSNSTPGGAGEEAANTATPTPEASNEPTATSSTNTGGSSDSSFDTSTGLGASPLNATPVVSKPAPALISKLAEVLGKANPLSPSNSRMILPALLIAAALALASGPAVALPAWIGTPAGDNVRRRLLGLIGR